MGALDDLLNSRYRPEEKEDEELAVPKFDYNFFQETAEGSYDPWRSQDPDKTVKVTQDIPVGAFVKTVLQETNRSVAAAGLEAQKLTGQFIQNPSKLAPLAGAAYEAIEPDWMRERRMRFGGELERIGSGKYDTSGTAYTNALFGGRPIQSFKGYGAEYTGWLADQGVISRDKADNPMWQYAAGLAVALSDIDAPGVKSGILKYLSVPATLAVGGTSLAGATGMKPSLANAPLAVGSLVLRDNAKDFAKLEKAGTTFNVLNKVGDVVRVAEISDANMGFRASGELVPLYDQIKEARFKGETLDGRIAQTPEAFRLKQLVKHDELFSQMPELGEIRVWEDTKLKGAGASYNPNTNTINISPEYFGKIVMGQAEGPRRILDVVLNKASIKDVLLHETTHAVQELGRLAEGGDPSWFYTQEAFMDIALRELIQSGTASGKEIKDARTILQTLNTVGLPADRVLRQEISNRVFKLIGEQEGATRLYKRLTGEAQAFSVEARSGMTAKEIAKHPFQNTVDAFIKKQGGDAINVFDVKGRGNDLEVGMVRRAAEETKNDPVKVLDELAKQPDGGTVTKVGNIRLDKLDISDEGKGVLAKIIDEHGGFIQQRRGKMGWGQTQQLADELKVSTRLKAGTSLNAEELKALGDTVVGIETKMEEISKEIAKGNNSDSMLAEFAHLKEEMNFALQSWAGARAEAGRSLQILRKIMESRLLGDEAKWQRELVEAAGGRVTLEEAAKLLGEVGNDPLARMKLIQQMAKVPLKDKIYEFWLNSILANPKTQIVNVVSNALNSMFQVPLRTVQAGVSKLLPGAEKVYFGEVPHQVTGMLSGFKKGVQKGLFVLKNGVTPDMLTKIELPTQAIKGTTGKIVRSPTTLLTAADEFFKAILSEGEAHALAYRKAIKEGLKGEDFTKRVAELIGEPTTDMLEAMDYRKLTGTFQEPLGSAGRAVINARNSIPGLRYIIPFIKTPTNIMKQALATSPAGFARVAKRAIKGNYASLPPGQLSEDIARAAIGSTLVIPVVYGAMEGWITGSAPKDEGERDAFYRTGAMPYSIKVGDNWYSYRRMEPLGTVIGLVADFTKITEEKELAEASMDIVSLIARNLNDKTFMSGLSAVIDAATDPERYGSKFIAQALGGFVPFSGAARMAAQVVDPTVRKPSSFVDRLAVNLPWLSKQVEARQSVFGEDVERELSEVLSPIAISKEQKTLVDTQLSQAGLTLNFPGDTAGGVKLTPEEYSKYNKIAGQATYNALNNLMSSEAWVKLTAAQKEDMVNKVATKVRDQVKTQLFPEFMVIPTVKQKLRAKGMTDKQIDEIVEKIVAKSR